MKAIKYLLNLTGHYQQLIPNYAAITKPLTDLMEIAVRNRVAWGKSQDVVFNSLK